MSRPRNLVKTDFLAVLLCFMKEFISPCDASDVSKKSSELPICSRILFSVTRRCSPLLSTRTLPFSSTLKTFRCVTADSLPRLSLCLTDCLSILNRSSPRPIVTFPMQWDFLELITCIFFIGPRSVVLNSVYMSDPTTDDLPLAFLPKIPVIPLRFSKSITLFFPYANVLSNSSFLTDHLTDF